MALDNFVTMKKTVHLTTFDEMLDHKYGERGTPEREQWEK